MKTVFINDNNINNHSLKGFTMEPTALLASLFDKKKLSIIKLFINQPEREWTLVEAAKSGRVSNATTYRILNKLVKLAIIEEHKIKHLKTYSLADNNETKYLMKMLETGDSAVEAFVDLLRPIAGIEQVVQLGKRTKEKTSILIIGREVDSTAVSDAERKIMDQFSYKIIIMSLDPQQYSQMVSMGLYPGDKRELYRAPEA